MRRKGIKMADSRLGRLQIPILAFCIFITTMTSPFTISSQSGSIYDPPIFVDDITTGGERPRRTITNYAVLEASWEKAAPDSGIAGFPRPQIWVSSTIRHSTPSTNPSYGVPSGFRTCDVPAPEVKNQVFTPLPPPPRHYQRRN